MSDVIPKMGFQSESDARAMAALGGGITDPNPEETAAKAAASIAGTDLSKAEGMSPPSKAGPAGQETADGSQMTPGPILNKGKAPKVKDDEDDEDDEEEKEGDEKMERSTDALIDDDLLVKALDEAINIARGASPDADTDRRAELADKLSKGETTPEELAELSELIKSELPSDDDGDEDLDKSFTEAALSDPDILANHKTDDGLDVSGFLARQNAFVAGALDSIKGETKEALTKGFSDMGRFNLAMAKANRALGQRVLEQGELIKSLGGRVETVENTPAPQRAATGVAALKKSLAAGSANQGLPGRQAIIDGLTAMNKSSDDGKAPCGMDITESVIRFESTGDIHPRMMADVKKAIGHNE